MKSKNKGITLIALVITIIILLILAGVTIGQLTGNGLFEKIQLAKEMSEQAQTEENTTLADYENKIGEYIYGTRNENLNNYSEEEQVIGTWIDGNTIYSKTIQIPSSSLKNGQWNTIYHNISDIDKIIDYYGMLMYGAYLRLGTASSSGTPTDCTYCFAYKNSIGLYIGSNIHTDNNSYAYITITYTKTSE